MTPRERARSLLIDRARAALDAIARVLLRLAGAAALFALAAALFAVMLVALEVRVTVSMLPSMVHREADLTRELLDRQIGAAQHTIQFQINEARQNADAHIRALRTDLIGGVQGTRTDALATIDQVSGRVLGEISNIRADLSGQLTTANETLADAATVTVPLKANLEAFHEQFMSPTIMLVDGTKRGNPGALYPRWLALSGEAMRTSDSFRRIADAQAQQSPAQSKAMTELAQNLAGITADIHVLTTEIVRPRTLGEKIWAAFRATSGIAILAWR